MEDVTIAEALKRFYGGERIGNEAFENNINYFVIGSIRLPFPNLTFRQKLIYLHDINHILTGYDTTQIGEGELAAYELASGFPIHCWVGYLYAPFAFVAGLVISSKRVLKAFRRGWGAKNACHAKLTKDELFKVSVSQLRQILKVPPIS